MDETGTQALTARELHFGNGAGPVFVEGIPVVLVSLRDVGIVGDRGDNCVAESPRRGGSF